MDLLCQILLKHRVQQILESACEEVLDALPERTTRLN